MTNDILIRALKTFWQAALAYLLADVSVLQTALGDFGAGRQTLITLGVGALAAGFSALWNGVLAPRIFAAAEKNEDK